MRQRRFAFAFFPYPTPYSAAQSGPEPTTYNITFDEVENGTLETSVTNGIAAGTTVTVTATPATGYECTQITTNGSALVDTTTFKMPAENVEIGATFALIPSFDVTFSKDNVAIAGSTTNVLRDTTLTADMIPVITDAGAWDVNPTNAVITCATNFNFTVATPLTPGEDIAKDLEGTDEEKAQAAAALDTMFNATGATEAQVNTWLGTFGTKPTAAQIAGAKSLDVSYNLGATTLFAQDPTAEIKTIEQAEPATAGNPCYELTFQITDGMTPATPAQLEEAVQGYVATLVQCNSKLDFGSETKLVPTVTVTLDGTATIKAKVELPSGGTSAFMKVATPATED